MKHLSVFALLGLFAPLLCAQTKSPLPPPAQDQGLPYTRSADKAALEKIKGGIAVFAGSRYGYVQGYRVRLSETDLLRAEAVQQDGVIYVPGSFAAVVGLKEIKPEPVPADLAPIADRWVYAPSELVPTSFFAKILGDKTAKKLTYTPSGTVATKVVKGETFYALADVAKAQGLTVSTPFPGFIYLGKSALELNEGVLRESVIALFDTPDKLAEPDLATKYIPNLSRQGKWTDHVKVTPEQQAILDGPETDWPGAPKSAYDETGINKKLFGSKVPAPGVYPRLLFSAEDLPMLRARLKSTTVGQMSLIEMEHLFRTTWWDPKTSDGQIFIKLSTGQLEGLEWDVAEGKPLFQAGHQFKGQKTGIYSSHIAYVPECLTAMALYCLLTNDDERGRQVATAIANYHKLREPLIDQFLQISDSEFGSSLVLPGGQLYELNAYGARTHWRNIHGVVAQMNLGLSLDFAGKWMTPEQKDGMRRFIAKATYGRRSHGQDGPMRFRDVNWMAWDLPHYIAVAAIEGLPGFDPEGMAVGAESARAFCDWGIDPAGVVFESNGKNPGAFQFQLLSMIITTRRGENLFAHPHWRRLLEGQTQMTSPDGKVIVNSGTQYGPHSRQKISPNLVTQLKAFYPESRLPDYLLTTSLPEGDEQDRFLPPDKFNPEDYKKKVAQMKRLRLPSITYPGFVRAVLYDADVQSTTREDVQLPLDFHTPVHGVFSSYSDRTPQAVWMNMMVRPNHYLGAGHHHADAGMFHFSANGVNWFTESPFTQWYTGNVHNLVLVDGKSEAEGIEGVVNGYNAAGKDLGSVQQPLAASAGADLTYAYSWRWNTQPPQVWSPETKALGWEMDPSPEILKIFAGTSRYKLRPWWSNYTYVNYIATSRALFNPMRHVYRTAGIVRGSQPYGFIVDDLQKDDAPHHYQWTGMLNGGVWKAEVQGLPANAVALAWMGKDTDIKSSAQKPGLTPAPGDPILLVYALGMKDSGDKALPLFQVETVEGQKDKKGVPQYYDRMVINQRTSAVTYRLLLLPSRMGEPLPQVSYDTAKQSARVGWKGQTDELVFTVLENKRSQLEITRSGQNILPKL